jgi:hypothetical protein
MPGFDSTARSSMNSRLVALFDKTCTIRARVESNHAQGQTETFNNRATGVSCSLHMLGRDAREDPAGGGTYQVTWWLIRVPSGQTVAATDQVVIGSRVFEVLEVGDMSNPTVIPLICTEVA